MSYRFRRPAQDDLPAVTELVRELWRAEGDEGDPTWYVGTLFRVADLNRDQVSEWDFLVFSGFGTQGATFSQIGTTDQWQIHSGLDGHNETITLSNHAVVHAGDFVFV